MGFEEEKGARKTGSTSQTAPPKRVCLPEPSTAKRHVHCGCGRGSARHDEGSTGRRETCVHKQMRSFWAKHELENGVSGDADALVGLPAWANNRFGFRQELSFHLTIAWDATMT